MTRFFVTDAYPIPFKQNGSKKCRSIDLEQLKKFWAGVPERSQRGCYVFALKVAQGYTPYYVGKAAKQSFEEECFTSHKLAYHYNDVVIGSKGFPCLFLVVQHKGPGKWSQSAIADVEEHLIAYAAAKNPELTNKRSLPNQKWSIEGVLTPGKGAPSKEAQKFKKLMGI